MWHATENAPTYLMKQLTQHRPQTAFNPSPHIRVSYLISIAPKVVMTTVTSMVAVVLVVQLVQAILVVVPVAQVVVDPLALALVVTVGLVLNIMKLLEQLFLKCP